jgi:hypothetical protein
MRAHQTYFKIYYKTTEGPVISESIEVKIQLNEVMTGELSLPSRLKTPPFYQ